MENLWRTVKYATDTGQRGTMARSIDELRARTSETPAFLREAVDEVKDARRKLTSSLGVEAAGRGFRMGAWDRPEGWQRGWANDYIAKIDAPPGVRNPAGRRPDIRIRISGGYPGPGEGTVSDVTATDHGRSMPGRLGQKYQIAKCRPFTEYELEKFLRSVENYMDECIRESTD